MYLAFDESTGSINLIHITTITTPLILTQTHPVYQNNNQPAHLDATM